MTKTVNPPTKKKRKKKSIPSQTKLFPQKQTQLITSIQQTTTKSNFDKSRKKGGKEGTGGGAQMLQCTRTHV